MEWADNQSIKNLVRGVRGHRVEEEIGCPRYLIWVTGQGAVRLCQEPENTPPTRTLIILDSNNYTIE